jgi:hypothetical protein
VYAPTANSTDEEIEEFYTALQGTIDGTCSQDLIMVMGDFNAKVGRDWSNWKGVLGKFGSREENEKGERLMNFCLGNNLMVMNTMLPKEGKQEVDLGITRW